MKEVVLQLAVFIILYTNYGNCETPLVKYNYGTVRGKSMTTFGGRSIAAFLGVPYASPPVGNNRFEPPKDAERFDGERDATEKVEDCLQYSQATYKTSSGIYGNEDCLYANIYTPKILKEGSSEKLLDVVVYIHGGVFMFTYAHYGPKYLLDQDIVLVTFNYRLGPLGFLSTEDDILPGNNGLKDQTKLLEWVNKNIKYFGGNPDSVTIAGTSAGSSSVHFHMISPLSKGLFHKAFSMSGTTLIPWAQAENAREKAERVAAELNCPTENSLEMKNCLKNVDGIKLVATSKKFMPWLYLPLAPFGPVIEVKHDQAFISESPINNIKKGHVNEVPWLVTMTSSEGLYPAADIAGDPSLMRHLEENKDELLPFLLDYNYTVTSEKIKEINSKIWNKYFYGEKAGSDVSNMLKMAGDRLFVEGIVKAAKLHAQYTKSPVYSYYFTYRGKNSISDTFSNSKIDFGASHGDDTSYVLQNKYLNPEETKSDIKMIKLLSQIWITFASTGKPQVGNITNWPLVCRKSSEGFYYVHIESPESVYVEYQNNLGHGQFWDSLEIGQVL
uniref:Carboxylic ester hydrolase n=1 Tax=Panstrongylus lignarius TaxID=156445 RepID=A0A224XMB6_9HEMI